MAAFISILLKNGTLDIPVQDVSMSETNFRFSDGIKEPFSTDFTIPKTENNVSVLKAGGVLDSTSQPFGDSVTDCILTINGNMITASLQVLAIRLDEIDLCVFQTTPLDEFKGKTIQDYYVDDVDTIYPWNVNTDEAYPQLFFGYDYGMRYSHSHAQYHPSKPLNDVLQGISSKLPVVPTTYRILASNKFVCPQNHIQVVEGNFYNMEGNKLTINGGQHIVNDLEWEEDGKFEITFNRDCRVNGKIWILYSSKPSAINDAHLSIRANGSLLQTFTLPSDGNSILSFDVGLNIPWIFSDGSVLTFECSDANRLRDLSFVFRANIYDYQINDEDYGNELKYVSRAPRLCVKEGTWSEAGWSDYVYHNAGDPYMEYLYFDGGNNMVTIHSHVRHCQTEFLAFSMFGFYCNVPNVEIYKILYSLCWVLGKKLLPNHPTGTAYFNPNDSREISAEITEIRTTSERLGQSNFILYNGQKTSESTSIVDVQNKFLETEKALHESAFSKNFHQYSNPEENKYSLVKNCDFEELDGLAIGMVNKIKRKWIDPVKLQNLGLEVLSQSIEITCETFNDVKDADFVYINGRKFFVIEVEHDFQSRINTLTALLVPSN